MTWVKKILMIGSVSSPLVYMTMECKFGGEYKHFLQLDQSAHGSRSL